jgi:hypothetical protein
MKNTDPLMGAKLKSKTHLLNRFFDPFFARLALEVEIIVFPFSISLKDDITKV